MTIAFLFPGQGSECPGMGGALLEAPGLMRRLLAQASDELGLDVAVSVRRGDASLRRTEVAQAALLAVGLGLTEALERAGVRPDVVAGHSVGELAALCVAGCLAPEEGMTLTVVRGRLMAEAAREHPGGMAAVRLQSRGALDAALASASAAAAGSGSGSLPLELELAAHNAPDEWVVSGDRAGLAALASLHPTVPLPVGGPWHHSAMAEAQRAWRARLSEVRWRAPALPVAMNRTGGWLREGDDVVALLAGQLTLPVHWAATLTTLAAAGVERWRIPGPGRILRGLCRANLGATVRVEIDDGMAPLEGSARIVAGAVDGEVTAADAPQRRERTVG